MPRATPLARSTLNPRRWLIGWLLAFLSLWSLAAFAPAYAAQAGIDWTIRTPAENNQWYSVAYGNGLFVAVASSGPNRVMTSPDGITWTARTAAAANAWQSVTYGNGLFVAVACGVSATTCNTTAGNRVMTSPNGIDWTIRTSTADISWRSVTYGNGLFVAVASTLFSNSGSNQVMTSPDGITWTARTAAADNFWYSVTYGNGRFVAVAGSGVGNRVMTSENGILWTTRTSAADNEWRSVTYGNGLFVAVAWSGTNNRVMTSSNGTDWTIGTSAADNAWNSVTYGNGLFVAVACGVSGVACNITAGNRVMTSSNGTDWTIQTAAVNNNWRSVSYVHDVFVAVASSGTDNRVMTSGALDACGPGLSYTTGQWLMLALPCVPTASPASVVAVFGNSPTANLDASLYDNATTGWSMYRREVTTTPSSYVKLATGTTLDTGAGYWLKSLSAPVGGKLVVTGTATPAPVTQANGCASANGCAAVTVQTVSGGNRYNLVGNPFPYAIDWSKVRIRVTVGGNPTVYSPCQAAGVASGCTGPAGAVASPPVVSNIVNIWNGSDYDAFSDLSPSRNLQYSKAFWVNVLPGAFGKTVELLIPAETFTLSQAAPAGLPWYLAWLDWVAPPAQAAATEEWVQLTLRNHVTGQTSGTVRLGRLPAAQPGYDAQDVPKMPPFAAPYLSLVVPHPEWGARASDYASDARPPSQGVTDWPLEVRASPAKGVVFLRWQGDAQSLERVRLIDRQTGQVIQPADPRWADKGYPITLESTTQRYIWRDLGR